MVNSKQKGNEFELKVAKLLSAWSGEEFHRTPMSGALHWNNDTRVISDIVPPQHLVDAGWPFSCECKKVQYDWDFSSILNGSSMFWKHWKQCYEDSQREEMIPLLIFSKNYREIYAVMPKTVFDQLQLDNGDWCPYMIIQNGLHSGGHNLVVFALKQFLESITCDEIIERKLLG